MSPARVRLLVGLPAVVLCASALCVWVTPPEDNQIRWSKIVWRPYRSAVYNADHAALMLEVRLDGARSPALMQLDLGAYLSVMYPQVYRDLHASAAGDLVPVSGIAAGRPFHGERFGWRKDAGEPDSSGGLPNLGTLGLSFFENRILILDYVNARVAILGKRAPLPARLEKGIEYLPIGLDRNLISVDIRIGGRTESNAVFDTGSSMIPFFTSRERWKGLTHRDIFNPANLVVRVPSWGKTAVLVGYPIAESFCVGSACVQSPLVYCTPSGLPNLDLDRYPSIAGIFGNVPFDGRYTVIVDLAGRRLGLLRGALAVE